MYYQLEKEISELNTIKRNMNTTQLKIDDVKKEIDKK